MMRKTGNSDNLELRKSGMETGIREFLSSRFKSDPAAHQKDTRQTTTPRGTGFQPVAQLTNRTQKEQEATGWKPVPR
jgi:hypothetical protein